MDEPFISIKNLVKVYGENYALNDVSIDIHKGETLALIGTSGCGKTTLLKSVNGLVSKTSGEIQIFNKSIDEWELVQLRRKIGYVIQDVGLFPHYTIEKNIGLLPEILGWEKAKISVRTDELLERIKIPVTLKSRFPDALSGGQKQRVGLARALASDPEIILMDEPFGALDPVTRENMQREFLAMDGLADKAILFVTHDMYEAALLSDRICLMDKGRVQQIGQLKELLFRPANSFVRNFLSSQQDILELMATSIADLIPFLNSEVINLISDSEQSVYALSKDLGFSKRDEILKTYYHNRHEILKTAREND